MKMFKRIHIKCHSESAAGWRKILFFPFSAKRAPSLCCASFRMTGFSITEVLMAVGVLAVGMIFIAGVFPVAIYFTTVSMERTIAAVAADEAFAKIRLYDPNFNDLSNFSVNTCKDFSEVKKMPDAEFAYPSTDITGPKQYYWSAICRRINSAGPNDVNNVQVTVFVSRKPGPGLKYPDPKGGPDIALPKPFKVKVLGSVGSSELQIDGTPAEVDVWKTYINDGSTIVDNATGKIYRVLERYASDNQDRILLDKNWEDGTTGSVWVVPPAVGSGKNPCMAVYQKEIRF
jgi:hypothetical protein